MNKATNDLLKVMALSSTNVTDIVKTIDGYYMGQLDGDSGYGLFLGKSSPLGQREESTRRFHTDVWNSLTDLEQIAVWSRAYFPPVGEPIDLELEFGLRLRHANASS